MSTNHKVIRNAFAGLELAAPSLERTRLVVVLAILQFFLEPSLEPLPARRTFLAFRTEFRQYRLELFAAWSIAQRGAAPGLTHEFRQRTQALGRDGVAPFAQCLWQQFTPWSTRQGREQLRTTLLDAFEPHVDRRIEARAAGLHYAQRGVICRERSADQQQT